MQEAGERGKRGLGKREKRLKAKGTLWVRGQVKGMVERKKKELQGKANNTIGK